MLWYVTEGGRARKRVRSVWGVGRVPAFVRNNPRGVAAVAVLLSAALAGGAAFALIDADDEGTTAATRPDVSVAPSVTPTPSATEQPSPTPEPSSIPTAAPTATASATAEPSPSVSASATASPRRTTSTFAYPKPSRSYDGLTLTVTLNPGGGNTGTTFELTAKGEDGDGEVYFDGLSWGDGASVASAGSPQQCKSYPPLTSPPGAYEPAPDTATFRYTHRYTAPGDYLIKVQVSSVNKDCKPNGPAKETRNVQVTVHVVSATPSPTPSAI